MQVRKVIISLICAYIVGFSLFASPARRGIVILTQPDGATFQAIMRGDEFIKIKTTSEGHAIVQKLTK